MRARPIETYLQGLGHMVLKYGERGGIAEDTPVHACDVAPMLLELVGVEPPAQVNGLPQVPLEGTGFAAALTDPQAPSKPLPQ